MICTIFILKDTAALTSLGIFVLRVRQYADCCMAASKHTPLFSTRQLHDCIAALFGCIEDHLTMSGLHCEVINQGGKVWAWGKEPMLQRYA